MQECDLSLLVNAGSDVDDGALVAVFGHGVDGCLDGDEVASAGLVDTEEVGDVFGRRRGALAGAGVGLVAEDLGYVVTHGGLFTGDVPGS
jgi:hypothetical protein